MHSQRLDIHPDVQLADIFAHISDQPWAMLLSSGCGEHSNANFDIFVAEPLVTLTCNQGKTCITHTKDNRQSVSSQSPLNLLQHCLDETFGTVRQTGALPFYAGALGYFGYDLGRQFEHLPNQAIDDYHSADMAVGLYAWAVIKDLRSGHFYLTSHDNDCLAKGGYWEALARLPAPELPSFTLTSSWQSNLTKQQYLQRFNKVQRYLRAGDCYQVNLAQRFRADYQGDEWQAFRTLMAENNAPFSAFLRLPESAIISVSPERFLQVEQGKVETKPIKGTRRHHHDPSKDACEIADLQHSEKDRAENLMIVDLLRNDLSKTCQPGSVKVPQLFAIESFPAVHHLVSTIVGQLASPNTPLDLLQGAFPGGSITGAPKVRAMQIIDELEPHRRNIYCGSIGYVSHHGHMDTNICIRTLLCEQQRIYCWAGGGLVLDSVGEDEYQETLDKVNKILPLLEH